MAAQTLKDVYLEIRGQLRESGLENPDRLARDIIYYTQGARDIDVILRGDEPVPAEIAAQIESYIKRCLAGEPISRIAGEREFWGLPFTVTPDVLDPRPDSETLVESALKKWAGNPPSTILDLGTGSGCLIIALLSEWPPAHGVAVDISDKALDVARANADRAGVAGRISFLQGSWGQPVEGSFDLIVSNPPYITNREMANLPPEVKNFDPILALRGGEDGLDCYKIIITETKRLLKKGGCAFFEVGFEQAEKVMRLVEDSGLCADKVHPDMAGIPRVVEISFGEK